MAKSPIAASYAIATAFSRQWWRSCGDTNFSGFDFARHRELVELPRAHRLLDELRALSAADRNALAASLHKAA